MATYGQKNKLLAPINIAIAVLVIVTVWLAYGRFQDKEKVEQLNGFLQQSEEDKDSLKRELSTLYTDYEGLKSDNDTLNKKLEEEQLRIKETLADLERVKTSNARAIARYKGEINTLRNVMKDYVHQMDSLQTLTRVLSEENAQIKTDYHKTRKVNERLVNQNENLNEKVEEASFVKAINLSASGIRVKGSETKKINKLDKIKVSFTLSENRIATKGMQQVYLRIARPDNYILIESQNNLFYYNGKQIAYSAMRQIDYQGKEVDVNIFWDRNENLIPGIYYADLYMNKHKIGTTTFTLK